jgi:hypothetical protein
MTMRFLLRKGSLFWFTGSLLWCFIIYWFFCPPPKTAVEYGFSRRLYPWILSIMTPLTGWSAFPLFTLLLVPSLIWLVVAGCRYCIRNSFPKTFLRGLKGLFWFFPFLVTWATLFWGAGYQRLTAEERLHLDTRAISAQEDSRLRTLLLETVKRNVPDGRARDAGRAVASISEVMQQVVGKWNGRPMDLPRRVKLMPDGWLLLMSTSGICSPVTLEALVDGGLPDTALVYTAAHELGHIAGFCSEAEATFVGYVAGVQSGDSFARYACALDAYMDLIAELKVRDFKSAVEALPDEARRDLKMAEAAYRQYRISWISRIGWRAYNRYLQAQGIKEGTRNYSRGITLFSSAWRQGLTWSP